MMTKSIHLPLLGYSSQATHHDRRNPHHTALFAPVTCGLHQCFEYSVCRLCDKEKCKAGAFIFPYRGPRSGQEPSGLKGGKPGLSVHYGPQNGQFAHDSKTAKIDSIEIPSPSILKSTP